MVTGIHKLAIVKYNNLIMFSTSHTDCSSQPPLSLPLSLRLSLSLSGVRRSAHRQLSFSIPCHDFSKSLAVFSLSPNRIAGVIVRARRQPADATLK
jgi:hypothetical protein